MSPLGSTSKGTFKRRIILTFVVGFFVLVTAFAVYMVTIERDNLYRDSREAAAGLAQSLAVSSFSWVLANDVMGLQEITQTFRNYPELRYAMVIAPNGRVMGHSDATKVGQYLNDEQSLALIKAAPLERVLKDDASFIDVAVPIEIGKRHVGWARIGLSREVVAGNLRQMILSSTFFVLFATLLSLFAAVLLANRLGQRIASLASVARQVQAGNFATRVKCLPGKDDEISGLATSLNLMLDALAQNDKQLREASRYTRSLIEASLDPLVAISPDGKITDLNQATENATGRDRVELIGTDFSDCFTDPDMARGAYQQAFLQGFVTDYPLVLRHRDGHVANMLYNASVYQNKQGEVLGVFASARDITERKQTEEALRSAAMRLNEAQRIAHLGNWELDLVSNALIWSDEIYRIFEIDQEQFGASYEAFLNAIHPEDREMVNKAYTDSVKEKAPYDIVHRLQMPDGRIKYVNEKCETYYADDGKPLRSVGTVHDITNRIRSETIMQTRLRLLEFAGSHSMDELLTATLDEIEALTGSTIGFYHFVEADQQTMILHSWSTNTINNMCSAEGIGRHYDVDQAGVWANCVRQRRPLIHNDYASLPDRKGMPEGHATVIREVVVPIFRGEQIVAIVGVGNKPANYLETDIEVVSQIGDLSWDVAERMRVEEALIASERRMTQCLANMPGFVYTFRRTPDGHLSFPYVSPGIESLFDLKPEDVREDMAPLYLRTHAEDRPRIDAGIDASARTMTLFRENFRVCRPNEPERWIEAASMPELDADGCISWQGVMLDITERKFAEEEVRRLNQELEQRVADRTGQLEAANKELEAFAYSVSHDLRVPLRAIDGFSHILLEDYAEMLDDEGKRLLRVVRDNTSRMGQLIEDILKFSRSGRLEMNFSEIDMEKLARAVFAELQPAVVESKLQLEIEPMPPAWGDSAMLRQVFVNLLSNAIKFSRTRETPQIKLGASVEGNETVYYLKDNGVGFDMRYADKLFGVFQRLHAVEEFEGTGIGLAIVKRIISRHGGRVWAESKVDEGATVYFSIPISVSSQKEAS